MDDEDGRCLLDVICDPQALNDFLHGSESQLDSDDLLGGSGDPAGSFFVGSGHHIQEPRSSTHLLASEPSAAAGTSVDLDFLEDDDILGSPQGGGGPGSDQPCDILQQSLAEANITEQSLQEAEEELDLGAFGLPSLPEGTPLPPPAPAPAQLFQGLPPLATPQGLVNKAINVQPFMQHMGLGNVTLQSLQGLQALPNGGPGVGVGGPLSGPLGISQIQVVGQQVMAIHQSGQPILAKSMGGYQLAPQHCAPQPPDSLQALQGKPPGGALNGGFGNGPGPPPSQGGATATVQCGSVLQPQNIVIQRTPTPIQPKPPTGGVIQPKIYQLSPKTSFSAGGAGPGGQASTQGAVPLSALQGEVGQKHQQQQQQQQQQQNVAFVAGKPGQQNLVLSTPGGAFPQALSASMFKHHQGLQQQQQSQQQQQQLNKPLSLHLLNQTGSIVIPSQAMLQGQGSFLLPPHLSSALQGGGQILAQHPGGGHIITSQGPGGQLIANQILSNHQGLSGQLNLGQMLASQGPQGHIQLSGPIQLQGGGQVGAHTLFQMPVSLAGGSLQTQTQSGGAVIQAVPSPALTVLNQSPEPSSQTLVSRQQQHQRSDSGLAGLMTSSSNEQQSQPPPPPPPPPPLPPSILTVQTSSGTPSPSPSSSSAVALSSSSSSSSSSQPLQISAVHLQQHQPPSLHSPGQIIISQQGAGMVLSQESVQRFLQQQQQALFQAAEKGVSPASSCVPASVIVSSSSDPSPSSRESLSAEARPGQVSASSFGSPHTLVYQISSTAQQQQQSKPLGASPSNTLPHPPSGSNSPQLPPLILGQMHSPHPSRPPSRPPSQPQPLSRPPSEPPLPRSCTPSQPPLFIIQNHPGGSPQPQPQQQQQQQQGGVTGPPSSAQSPVMRPHSQSPYQLPPASQPERRAMGSPQPLHLQSPESRAGLAVPMGHYQFHFQQPAQQPMQQQQQQQQQQQSPGLGLQAQPPAAPPPMQTLHLTAEQQQNLQLVGAQLQTLSTIAQPSLQQRQLLDKLLQIQHNIILQAKQQTLSSSQVLSRSGLTQFSSNPQTSVLVSQQAPPPVSIALPSSQAKPPPPQPDPAHSAAVTSQGAGPPAQLASLLQQTSVVVKTPGTGSGVSPAMQSEGKSFPSGGVQIKQGELLPVPQTVQGQPGVISSVGGLSVSKGELQMQVLGAGVPQILHTASMQTQPQLGSVTRPFSAPPSKEARMLEQLRRQQGAVLHPDYQSPFSTFGDALQRLLPYHLYQGTPSSGKDYTRVDEEFESVSVQLLKRTQAMLNKYRLLLFEESRRQGPSAEMVMIDRMFIQEEKTALSQDKVLVKERPDEYVLPSCVTQGLSTSSSSSCPRPPASSNSPSSSATAPPLITPTKLVIKHAGGASPSVSWARATPPPSVTSSPGGGDADSLPSRSSRPPMKTYEARRRIGLKLKIKQEAGLSKVVHNTALDPVHTPPSTPKTHAPGSTVIQTLGNVTVPGPGPLPSQPFPPTVSTATGTPTVITANQVNGTPGHPADRKQPTPTSCRLPLRKTYRENVCPAGAEQKWGGGAGGGHFGGPPLPQNTPPTTPTSTTTATTVTPQQRATLPRRPQTQQQALLEEEEEEEEGEVERGRTVIARVRLEKKGRSPRHEAVIFGKDRERAIPKQEELKQLSGAEEEFYRGAIKQEPPDHYSPGGGLLNTHPGFSGPARARGAGLGGSPEGEGGGSSWDSPFPSAAKRRKLESLDVDNASFSSGSPPQDDSLNEHLQTAIDSILNLQQGQGPPRPQPGPCRGPSNTHRQQQQQQQPAADPTYPPRSRNGGVGKARTYSR